MGTEPYSKTKTVAFYSLACRQKGKRTFYEHRQIDWLKLFEGLRAKPDSELQIGDVMYEPLVSEGHAVLLMHRPLSPEFLTKAKDGGGRSDATADDEKDLRRFSQASVAVFIGEATIFGLGKGGAQASPGTAQVRAFLDKFVVLGEGSSWRAEAYLTGSDLNRLRAADAVRRFSYKYQSDRTTLDAASYANSTSLDISPHQMAEEVDSDLTVSIEVALPGGASRIEGRNLRDLVLKALQRIDNHSPTGAPPKATAMINGEEEELFLRIHKLTKTVEISRDVAASGTFSALVDEVVRVAIDTEQEIPTQP